MDRYYFKGAYKGMKDLYNKRISPYFNTYNEALHYKQCHGMFSLSLSESIPTKETI